MKIKKLLVTATLVFTTMSAFSTGTPVSDPGKNLVVAEIASMLKDPQISSHGADLLAQVYLMLNREGEIVVLQVEAENDLMESYIKDHLNYKKLKCKALVPGKQYRVPVRIKSKI